MAGIEKILFGMINPRNRFKKLKKPEKQVRGGIQVKHSLKVLISKLSVNYQLWIGTLMVLGLAIVFLFGPSWAPYNLYVTGHHIANHYDQELGKYVNPPLEPGEDYPLGTNQYGSDLLSMVLYGARTTLLVCSLITVFRTILGVIMGGLAGYNQGSFLDASIMSLIGVFSSLPILISSVLVLFALDISKGIWVFVVALTIVGWTEIAQYVRSEFIMYKKMAFVEGAKAIGLSDLGIAIKHILPNVLPQLIIVAFLEMGAVTMLMGELGFIGVYIGGGSQVLLFEDIGKRSVGTLIDYPEWGAMMAEGARWIRSKPFIILPSAIAFFISILGFNLFGEGLKRLIEDQVINVGQLMRKRYLVLIAAILVVGGFIVWSSSPNQWINRVAESYSGDQAYHRTAEIMRFQLSYPEDQQVEALANYFAYRYEETYGLRPGWKKDSYIRQVKTIQINPEIYPTFQLMDQNGVSQGDFHLDQDYAFNIEGVAGSGSIEGGIVFVGFQPKWSEYRSNYFRNLDMMGKVVVVLESEMPPDFIAYAQEFQAGAVILISEDDQVTSQWYGTDLESSRILGEGIYDTMDVLPVYRISRQTGEKLFQLQGYTLEDLYAHRNAWADSTGNGWFSHDLVGVIKMDVQLGNPVIELRPMVLGYMIGSDLNLFSEMMVVFVDYDQLGLGTDDAQNMGLVFSTLDLWQKYSLDSRRSILFVSWFGENAEEYRIREYFDNAENLSYLPSLTMWGQVYPILFLELNYHNWTNSEEAAVSLLGEYTGKLMQKILDTKDVNLIMLDPGDSDRCTIYSSNIASICLEWQPGTETYTIGITDAVTSAALMDEFGYSLSVLLTNYARLEDFE